MKKFVITEEERKHIMGLYEQTTTGTTQTKVGADVSIESLPKEFQTFIKQYGLTGTFNQTGQSSSSGEYGYNKGNTHNGFNTSEIKTYETYKADYQKCLERSKEYKTIIQKLGANRMDNRSAKMEADKQINQKYPNMTYCGVVMKIQKIVNDK